METRKITKEFIITYLKEYYLKYEDIPKSRDKSHPFSDGTVRNKFGSWANALIEANIPLRVNPSQILKCDKCNTEFRKLYKEIIKSKNHFCSRSCSASYTNTKRSITEDTKQKISNSIKQYNINNPKDIKIKICIICKKEFNLKKRKTCSKECAKLANSQGGHKGGTISAANNVRRSKGEIHFANLCIEYFGKDDILCNELIFKDKNDNYWDSDIFIKSIGVSILYNGIWHYKQVREKHNLKQVQSRDKIKMQVILNNGYTYYIVKDLGRYNESFIIYEFNLFIHKLNYKKTLNQIEIKIEY
jgi:hypothetical protein